MEISARKSGEPYIIHPLWVAIILADLEMDKETIAAGMLHDVVEDTEIDGRRYPEGIRRRSSASGRWGYQAGTDLSYSSDKLEVQAENLRKMFLAMAKDIRVIIIKLADRLHNMRTLEFMTPGRSSRKKHRRRWTSMRRSHSALVSPRSRQELDDLSLKYS